MTENNGSLEKLSIDEICDLVVLCDLGFMQHFVRKELLSGKVLSTSATSVEKLTKLGIPDLAADTFFKALMKWKSEGLPAEFNTLTKADDSRTSLKSSGQRKYEVNEFNEVADYERRVYHITNIDLPVEMAVKGVRNYIVSALQGRSVEGSVKRGFDRTTDEQLIVLSVVADVSTLQQIEDKVLQNPYWEWCTIRTESRRSLTSHTFKIIASSSSVSKNEGQDKNDGPT